MTEAISQDLENCQFLFWLMKNPMFYWPARLESGRRHVKGSLGQLALAGGIRLSDGLSEDIANTVRALDRSGPQAFDEGATVVGEYALRLNSK